MLDGASLSKVTKVLLECIDAVGAAYYGVSRAPFTSGKSDCAGPVLLGRSAAGASLGGAVRCGALQGPSPSE